MDGFAVDLDHLLDEFEQNEENQSENSLSFAGNNGGYKNTRKPPPGQAAHPDDTWQTRADSGYLASQAGEDQRQDSVTQAAPAHGISYSPLENLDLSEADFAPSPVKALQQGKAENSSDINGSYFVPEVSGDFNASGDATAVVLSSEYSSATSSLDQQMTSLDLGKDNLTHKPELLQDTRNGQVYMLRNGTEGEGATGFGEAGSQSWATDTPVPSVGTAWVSQPDVVPTELSAVKDVSHAACHEHGTHQNSDTSEAQRHVLQAGDHGDSRSGGSIQGRECGGVTLGAQSVSELSSATGSTGLDSKMLNEAAATTSSSVSQVDSATVADTLSQLSSATSTAETLSQVSSVTTTEASTLSQVPSVPEGETVADSNPTQSETVGQMSMASATSADSASQVFSATTAGTISQVSSVTTAGTISQVSSVTTAGTISQVSSATTAGTISQVSSVTTAETVDQVSSATNATGSETVAQVSNPSIDEPISQISREPIDMDTVAPVVTGQVSSAVSVETASHRSSATFEGTGQQVSNATSATLSSGMGTPKTSDNCDKTSFQMTDPQTTAEQSQVSQASASSTETAQVVDSSASTQQNVSDRNIGTSSDPSLVHPHLSNSGAPQFSSLNDTEYDSSVVASVDPADLGPIEVEGILDQIVGNSSGRAEGDPAPAAVQEGDRRGSEGSVERFLVPSITSPMVTTPMEESGFSKVPGFTPDLSSMEEEAVEAEGTDLLSHGAGGPQVGTLASGSGGGGGGGGGSGGGTTQDTSPSSVHASINSAMPGALMGAAPSQAVGIPGHDHPSSPQTMSGSGARPKELSVSVSPQPRKNRPNSLLGLSTPDIGCLKPQAPSPGFIDTSGFAETASPASDDTSAPEGGALPANTGNAHDIINMQLAQKNMSPLRKTQLNLEIKQRINEGGGMQSVPGGPGEATAPVASPDPPPGLAMPFVPPPLPQAAVLPGQPVVSPGSQPSVGGPPVAMPPASLSLPPPASDLPPGSPSGFSGHPSQPGPGDGGGMMGALQQQQQQQQPGRQRRPNSLSLPPRGEFQPNLTPSPADNGVGQPGIDGNLTPSGSTSSTPSQSSIPPMPPTAPVAVPGIVRGAPGGMPVAPPTSSNINLTITQLGKVAPEWVPDSEAAACMQCELKFTFTKRRHHCRACGKVFCSQCCNLRTKIAHMDNKEARVCSKCYQDLIRAQVYEKMNYPGPSPNPNNPSEYCSTVPPMQQVQAGLNAPPPAVMVPTGVLRKEGSQRRPEPRQVMFSDGIRPGGDLTELDGSSEIARLPPQRTSGRRSRKVEKTTDNKTTSPKARTVKVAEATRTPCLIPETGLPPVLLSTGIKGDFSVEENPEPEKVLPQIRSTEDPSPVVFAINKNLFVMVKIVNLDCCVNRVCWCFTTKGMCTVGQEELVIVLECLPEEKTIPRDVFCHFLSVYEEASKGNTVSNLGHTIFAQGFLDSRDHSGFLYIRPTFQCLQKLLLPQPPYVFGILLQKWETPWAKIFPVRLMLRLGAEYRYYPCPLISVRFRKPVYGEIGHTIMNLLADFRNYQYMLPQARGVTIHMEDKKTYINLPRNRYNDVMKILDGSNDHVMAFSANFSTEADSHLVCIQNEDGNYQTQAINIQNKPRKVTGASFVVFNGALKSTSGLRAKSSIVEDGLMVQIMSESMVALKQAIKDMQGYTVGCGSLDAAQPEEYVILQWVDDDKNVNIGVKSPIDNMAMDGVESLHLHNTTDYIGEHHTLRWTEVFFIRNEDQGSRGGDPVDLSRLGETLAQACCLALTPHLDKLKEASLTKIGLRVKIDAERVGYEVGANGEKLPDHYMNDMDNELIPVIHNAASHSQDGPVVLELILHIID